jgi:hypothetical protein
MEDAVKRRLSVHWIGFINGGMKYAYADPVGWFFLKEIRMQAFK